MKEIRFKKWKKPLIKDGKPTKWNWLVRGVESLELGKDTDIGAFCYINATAGVVIENNVQIGGGVKIYSISTIDNKKGKIVLKKNCKIGANSVIMPGVTIGENSIVGALSFVTKDIPDNVLAYGVPAKVIKKIDNV
ncbi:MAG: acyltransferase [Candidatus Staskawiczbacteria bacterium]|nr:acyltransferase [Candidatus Staskawiczbacteria bacterium]MBI3337215.1 acyltransferase [Candidatus Staskawiczbacteria bacterium]